jgi:hypothetical protein
MSRALSRDATERLAAASRRYRRAFQQVQSMLSGQDDGQVPGWVFALDRHTLEEVQTMSPELYAAELHRRRCRRALHALVELIALDDPGASLPSAVVAAEDPAAALDDPEKADLAKLDRFISVIHAAREGGAIYVNGTFDPVTHPPELTKPNDTFDLAPERE